MTRRRPTHALGLLGLLAVLAAAAVPRAAGAADPVVAGSLATYRWTPAARAEVPVLVQQPGPGGAATWSVEREAAPAAPLFVTYSIPRADARRYVLQIATHQTLDGPPLSVTQVTVDRATGRATRSVIRRPQGPIATPEDGTRPFRADAVRGTPETVEVAAGRFETVRAPYRDGVVWVADGVPALGLAKASLPGGQLELVRSARTGAKDLLRP
jgi:hypothetical protein